MEINETPASGEEEDAAAHNGGAEECGDAPAREGDVPAAQPADLRQDAVNTVLPPKKKAKVDMEPCARCHNSARAVGTVRHLR